MKTFRAFSIFAALFITGVLHAQQNYIVTPEKPKPGDLIKITYTPAGDIANTMGKVEGAAYIMGTDNMKAVDLVLTKSGKKYTTSLQTDTSQNFVQVGFFVDAKYDNNFDEGYFIQLFNGEKVCRGSFANLASVYMGMGYRTQVSKNVDKAITAYEKEFELYPEQKRELGFWYYQALISTKKDGIVPVLESEIEAILKNSLKDEADYSLLNSYYNLAKLPEQAKWIDGLKKTAFPNGKWKVNEKVQQFFDEKDPAKKEALLDEIRRNTISDPNWKSRKSSLARYESEVLSSRMKTKDWEAIKKAAGLISDKSAVSSVYNNTAWDMQEKNEDLPVAREFSQFATEYTRSEWLKPTVAKPAYLTTKQWNNQREGVYATYADTYAMVLFKLGDYKKGLPFAVEASRTINHGNDPDLNTTYSLLAEKVLSPKELKPELEGFVKSGAATSTTKEILKRLYTQEKSSEAGFEQYIAALEKENYLKMLEELRKGMINQPASGFSLKDLSGTAVTLADLKGKLVIVDFWATWCGPCKASFPAMQKMVDKYKSNSDVAFLFIDSWERVDNKTKNAVDFVASNKYSFHVLMDDDNKVIEQFKVDGIPTKFVIDKSGAVRFKSVGFRGDDKLIAELTAMIEMANGDKLE